MKNGGVRAHLQAETALVLGVEVVVVQDGVGVPHNGVDVAVQQGIKIVRNLVVRRNLDTAWRQKHTIARVLSIGVRGVRLRRS